MLIIEGILRMDDLIDGLYSPNYFNTVDAFTQFIKDNRCYLLGWTVKDHSPTTVTLRTTSLYDKIDTLDWVKSYGRITLSKYEDAWVETKPPIPPSLGYLNDKTKINMGVIQDRYLRERDSTAPRYIYLDAAYGDVKVVKTIDGTSLDLMQTSYNFDATKAIYFVNGLCCRPTVRGHKKYGELISLANGAKYNQNRRHRDRGVVIMDFTHRCEVEYRDVVADAYGNIHTPIPEENASYLLVVDGRLFLPKEFSVAGGYVHLAKSAYKSEYGLDRMCCENDTTSKSAISHRATSSMLFTRKNSLTEYENTFLIVLKRPGLKIIKHNNSGIHQECVGEVAYFRGNTVGLIFNTTTRSVSSFTRVKCDNEFYCVDSITPVKWNEVVAYMVPETVLEIWALHNDNMSVRASLNQRASIPGTGLLLSPRYAMLDFIFEG